jgi:hypothetical protein
VEVLSNVVGKLLVKVKAGTSKFPFPVASANMEMI